MQRAKKAGGRPRSVSPTATPELVALAEFLWSVLDKSGLSVEEVQARFTKEHFPNVHAIPSVSTMYKRLRCIQIENAGRLVDAIIDVCASLDERDTLKEKANELKSLARARRPTLTEEPTSDDCRAHLTQLAEAQQRIISMQDKAFQLQEGGQGSRDQESANVIQLRMELEHANADRFQLTRSLAAARREIQVLKSQMASTTVLAHEDKDHELDRIEQRFRELDPDGKRFAAVIRRSFDLVYDGARTGRFSPDQLSKMEKAHLGMVVETELCREFDLAAGNLLDVQIGGVEVDLRFSRNGAWMIPAVAKSQLCLLISADDSKSEFSVGLLRATPECLTASANRDGKRSVSVAGRESIRFLVRDARLPENALLHTDNDDIAAIFVQRNSIGRASELFRRVQGRKVDHGSLNAVVMQDDVSRRVRDARRVLSAEGVVLLGYTEAWICTALGLPEPSRREFVSARLAQKRPQQGDAPTVEIEGIEWVVATPDDPVEPAPTTWKQYRERTVGSPQRANAPS